MVYYRPLAETKIIVNASPYGLGAILTQTQPSGEFRPIVYASRVLTTTEQRYSQTEQGRLSVLGSFEQFHYYLYDKKFTVITDHKLQDKLLSSKGAPTLRIRRWLLKMSPYDYTIRYEPKRKNPSDILPYETPNDDTKHNINATINDATLRAVFFDEKKQESHTDDTIKAIIKCITSRKRNKLNST